MPASSDAFRQSRIFAEGWNAARRKWTLHAAGDHHAAENPYSSEPERMRWNEGFAQAQARESR